MAVKTAVQTANCTQLAKDSGKGVNTLVMSADDDDDEPKSPRKRGGMQKRKNAGNVFRDDNGRVISREEAKRIRK